MDGHPHGGHPFRQDLLIAKGNSVSGVPVPTAVPTGEQNAGLRQGELAWIAYTSMFGDKTGEWDDLSLADKARWSCVEAGILRESDLVLSLAGGAVR